MTTLEQAAVRAAEKAMKVASGVDVDLAAVRIDPVGEPVMITTTYRREADDVLRATVRMTMEIEVEGAPSVAPVRTLVRLEGIRNGVRGVL